jgi:sugar phosphate isomerase/epimerase
MKLHHGLHLCYSTNIHRGENWEETFAALNQFTLAVREQVAPGKPYAIGLRLSDLASRELAQPPVLKEFRHWLDARDCYIFTMNGFPFGRFHGARVKEQVYLPDWSAPERVEYTNRLFDLLAELMPDGLEGSVSTVPVSFKEFNITPEKLEVMRENLWQTVEHIARLSERSGKLLHLGLEPEPLCHLETSEETVRFFEQMRDHRPGDSRISRHLGVNYDNCHLAVEFEEPAEVVRRFVEHEIKISKLHFSSALKVRPSLAHLDALEGLVEDVYFHQVVSRDAQGRIQRFRDLDVALAEWRSRPREEDEAEWRIHFHIPLHCQSGVWFESTSDHILGVMDILQTRPGLCPHLEMETYTWEVLPPELKNRDVVDQLVAEYRWCLDQLGKRGLGVC